MRIRGQIGDWPVDLTIELAPEEWAQLGKQIEVPAVVQGAATPTVAAPRQDDGQWTAARDVLRLAGQMSGPELLDRLEGWREARRQANGCWCACGTAVR